MRKRPGRPRLCFGAPARRVREFLHVDDCADALVHIMKVYSENRHINVGSGKELSILELAKLSARAVGFEGKIAHDLSKPDGTPRKLMDSSRLKSLGWQPGIGLEEGIRGNLSLVSRPAKPGLATACGRI